MKRYFNSLFSSLLILGLSGYAVTVSASPITTTDYLFVQTAKKAELSNKTLTLHGVSTNTVWFTDRPNRKFGKVDTQVFIDLWKPSKNGQGFAQDAPNAVMVDQDSSTGTLENLGLQGLTLYAPSYNPKTGDLSYQITLQTGTLKAPVALNDVALFVDDMNSTEIVFASTYVPFDSSF